MSTIRQQLHVLDLEGETEVLVPMDYIIGLLNRIDRLHELNDKWVFRYAKLDKMYDNLLAQSLAQPSIKYKRLDVKG